MYWQGILFTAGNLHSTAEISPVVYSLVPVGAGGWGEGGSLHEAGEGRTGSGIPFMVILVPRFHDRFSHHQGLRPLAGSNSGSQQFTDFLSNLENDWLEIQNKYSEHAQKNQVQPKVLILGADQKDCSL